MAGEDLARAIMALDDDAVRRQVTAGDFAPLRGLELTNDELQMLQRLEADDPEVSGFGGTNEESPDLLRYAQQATRGTSLQPTFDNWLAQKGIIIIC